MQYLQVTDFSDTNLNSDAKSWVSVRVLAMRNCSMVITFALTAIVLTAILQGVNVAQASAPWPPDCPTVIYPMGTLAGSVYGQRGQFEMWRSPACPTATVFVHSPRTGYVATWQIVKQTQYQIVAMNGNDRLTILLGRNGMAIMAFGNGVFLFQVRV